MQERTINLVAMLAALAAACLLPFELLVLAYAFLGPAHYLTEISWLRQKRFFLQHRLSLLILLLLALIFIVGFGISPRISAVAMLAAVTLCLLLTVENLSGRLLAASWAVAVGILFTGLPDAATIAMFAILVPTLVHVCVFTFMFMLVGARRGASRFEWLVPACYLVSILCLIVLPIGSGSLFGMDRLSQEYFSDVSASLSYFLAQPIAFSARLCALLSFVYTYHYLNWFVKVRTIRWADIPLSRLCTIIIISLAAGYLYLYDYALGFAVLATLSILHVFLELPLNAVSVSLLRRTAR